MRAMSMAALGAAALALAGCAKRANEITPSYASPVLYQRLTCEELGLEAQRVARRAAEASGQQNQKATGDAVMFTVGMVVFWPALFAMRGDDATSAELARLLGELEAIEQVSTQKKCAIVFKRPEPIYPEPPPLPSDQG